MKNRIIIAAAFTACLALCAAVWPQTEMVEETPMPVPLSAVSAPLADIPEPEPEPATVVAQEKEAIEPTTTESPPSRSRTEA